MNKKKVLIVDDHPVVVRGLSQVINKQNDLMVCGAANSAIKAIKLINELNPDIITLDLSLKDSNGLELIKDLLVHKSDVPILVISMYDENIYAERVLKAGAKGYIMKEKVTKELLKALYKVLDNKVYISEDVQNNILNSSMKNINLKKSIIDILSDRELEVFDFTGDGLTTSEIAKKTNLGIKTIETYKTKIKEKLKIKNSTLLVKYAVEWKMNNKI